MLVMLKKTTTRPVRPEKPRKVLTLAKPNPLIDAVIDTAAARAKGLVKRFVGRASGAETAAHHPGLKQGTVVANLKARLDYLKVRNPHIDGGMIQWGIRGDQRPEIMSKSSGRQYVFVGGNQDCGEIPTVGTQWEPTAADCRRTGRTLAQVMAMRHLGEVLVLGYTARKHVDNYKLQAYYHKLGEENGDRPHLFYDARHKQLYLVGGNYRTEAEGMAN